MDKLLDKHCPSQVDQNLDPPMCSLEGCHDSHARKDKAVLTVHLDTGSMVPPDVVDFSFQ